jgi:hypothetical protein
LNIYIYIVGLAFKGGRKARTHPRPNRGCRATPKALGGCFGHPNIFFSIFFNFLIKNVIFWDNYFFSQ